MVSHPQTEESRVEHDFGTIHSEFPGAEVKRGITSVENESSRLIAGAQPPNSASAFRHDGEIYFVLAKRKSNPMPANLNGKTRSTFTYSIPLGGTFVLAPRDSNGQSAL